MTVRDALRLPPIVRGRPEVVAGLSGLDRTVRWAHAGEVANIAEMLTGGELLLTTGMGIGTRPARQRRFVYDLARRSVAAIALELGPSLDEVPAALVAAADDNELPLILFRRATRFVEITEAVHRAILGRQLELLRRGDETHRRFTDLLLEGAGVPEVLTALAHTVRNPVLLERGGEIVSHATYRGSDAEALAGWRTVDALALSIPSGRGSSWGVLRIPEYDTPIDVEARIAAERAVGVLAVVLLRDGEEQTLALSEHGRFLAALAGGGVAAYDAQVEADALGFGHSEWLLPLAIASRQRVRTPPRQWLAFCRTLRDDLADRRIPALAGTPGRAPDGPGALIVVSLPDRERRRITIEQIASATAAAAERHLGSPADAVLAVGPVAAGWADLGELLSESASAAALAVDEDPRPWHDASVPSLRRLLWRLRDDPTLRAYSNRTLAPVLEHDSRRPSAPLLPTLEALCDHGWSKAEAARALHVERQSVYPRVARLEQLLGADLGDPREQAALDVARLVHRFDRRAAAPGR